MIDGMNLPGAQPFPLRLLLQLPLLAILLSCVLAPALALGQSKDPLNYFSQMEPLLFEHCADCHIDASKGGVSFEGLESLTDLLAKSGMWRKLKEAVQFGDMPPDRDDTGFNDAHAQAMIQWIESNIEVIDPTLDLYRDPGPAVVRPLTPTEYNNTIRDVLGIQFDVEVEAGITETIPLHGFSNTAASMAMDQVILEKYFSAADKVLTEFAKPENAAIRRRVFAAHPDQGIAVGEAAKRTLYDLGSKAYRRSISTNVVSKLGPLFAAAYRKDRDFDAAIAKALKPLLVSPMFLYRMEKPTPTEGHEETGISFQVIDSELAVRLSYFLWSTMPDEELRQLAATEKLKDPAVLERQIRRMLQDPKASALAENFANQWLKIYKLDEALPSRAIYPSFTDELKEDMRREVMVFFENIMREDRSVMDLISADYTYVNERLASHYGFRGVSGEEFRQVNLLRSDNRGGILGMGSFLASTSHTDRTKPTARGEYVLDVILGTPPTLPPADAAVFKTEEVQNTVVRTFRDKLNLHASDPACAACHKKIDPLGFALENFDPVGRWKDDIDGEPIDNRGKLPTGDTVVGFQQLKQLVIEREDLYLKNITTRMLGYALGRHPEYYDALAVEQIVQRLKDNDYRFSELILGITDTIQFRHRRKLNPQSVANR